MYGPIPIKIAWHWPIITSCDNLSVYANVKGGRLPTEPELRLFLDKFNCGFEGGANVGFRNWHPVPCVNDASKLESNSTADTFIYQSHYRAGKQRWYWS